MVDKFCEVCGKGFSVIAHRENKAKTCSIACRNELARRRNEDGRVKSKCLLCGKEIALPKSHAARGDGKFCSKQCQASYMTGKPGHKRAHDGKLQQLSTGYVYERCDGHPFASRGKVFQHRLVMERVMRKEAPEHPFLVEWRGEKYLRHDIHVHHVNEIKSDNRPENLVACTSIGHKDLHAGNAPMPNEVWPVPAECAKQESRSVRRKCKTCGTHFVASLGDVKRGGGKFCSRKCLQEDRYSGDLPPVIQRKCLVCGEPFSVKRHKVVNGTGKYCSNKCRHAARVGKPITNINPYKE